MAKPFTQNTLFYGDNLPVLREHFPDECIDLIYLDPPFNSNRSYNVLFKDESGISSEAQITAFDDTWHWGEAAEQAYNDLIKANPGKVDDMIVSLRQFIGTNQMMAYLVMMATRLVELHRVLKPTGSLYLHCDPTASHYLRVILDTIFGPEKFLNQVIWKRTAVKGDVHRKFGAVHDTLLVYVKTSNYKFQPLHIEGNENYKIRFKYDDYDGRGLYQSAPLDSPNPRPNLTYEYKGYKPPIKGWRISLNVMEKLESEGKLIFPASMDGRIRRKVYLNEQEGPKVTDVWTDIPPLQGISGERLGYPTQKPLSLLERVILTSSKPGDLILDPFCGCGTAIAAAEKLNRRWIGIDITHLAISLIKYRMKDMFPGCHYEVIGEPDDIGAAHQLASDDRYQFQWWALSLVRARPVGSEPSSKVGKKGSDKGIDGVINFMDDSTSVPQRIIVQVKSGHVKAGDVRDLHGVVDREKAAIGVFLTLENPSAEMVKEAAAAGFYTSPMWQKEYRKIQILTIDELLGGKEINMPPDYGTFKQAPKEKKEEGKQKELGM